ncbi:hypothetical protein RIR_jg31422.t1 [Rhizophagus irregularis DAOM 181602=DAOM 197198]|nr:hypothetical protein RIR_jg31422.t1 [Rhizophagus irregularis DAOM 181602=DAOM 197198]
MANGKCNALHNSKLIIQKKTKIRENENPDQRTKRRARDRKSKSKNRAAESPEKRQERLERERTEIKRGNEGTK